METGGQDKQGNLKFKLHQLQGECTSKPVESLELEEQKFSGEKDFKTTTLGKGICVGQCK